MEGLGILGQYLILTFVLPGFCYLLVFALCFPHTFRAICAGLPTGQENSDLSGKQNSSLGWWLVLLGFLGGLLVSSVTFAIEVVLRTLDLFHFNDIWFRQIAFDKMSEAGPPLNLFAPMAFMHFNIGVGVFVILLAFFFSMIARHCRAARLKNAQGTGTSENHEACECSPRLPEIPKGWLTIALFVLVVANIIVSSHLFHRVECMVRTKEGRSINMLQCMSEPLEHPR